MLHLQALHHPFTAPNPEDMNDLASARALAYDMVYNGVEVSLIIILEILGSKKFTCGVLMCVLKVIM